MTMLEVFKKCIRNYVVFDGRARRKEYWYFTLFNILVVFGLTIIGLILYAIFQKYGLLIAAYVLMGLYYLFILLPSLAVTFRRLHDTGRSGTAIFISLVPCVGEIILLIWLIEDSYYGTNKYGENPKNLAPEWQQGIADRNERNNVQNRIARQFAREQQPDSFPKDVEWDRQMPPEGQMIPASQMRPAAQMRPANDVYQPQIIPAQQPLQTVTVTCVGGSIAGKSVRGSQVLIGRSRDRCQLVFSANEPGVSRLHCKVAMRGGRIELTDLGSSNGTYLRNGYKLEPNKPVLLKSGDSFYLGSKNDIVAVHAN